MIANWNGYTPESGSQGERALQPQSDTSFRVKLIRSTKDSLCSKISLALALGLDKYLSVTMLSKRLLIAETFFS
ncbi:jg14287 [Pararge aegeria aegeria]|uniref:Jg14287 protein n=1 Tax=Pararge aegeria aegeria TaxID=348720 RepID=A0A8S4RRE0_9NEOP|nr:jg14287 [Pararge aegeria aegeria]